MSGVDNNSGLSRAKAQSLAGQILKKLDAADGEENGKIKGSIWNRFFNGDETNGNPGLQPGRNDGVDIENDEIALSDVYSKLMTRIFNAAKKALGGTAFHDSDSNLTADAHAKINNVAKEWLNKAGELTDTEQVTEDEPSEDTNITALNTAKGRADGVQKAAIEFGTQLTSIDSAITEASKTEGKSKDEVDEAKANLQNQIDTLRKQVEAEKAVLTGVKQSIANIKDDAENETLHNALTAVNTEITAAEGKISEIEGKITQLTNALNAISSEGLKTKDELRLEKRDAAIDNLINNLHGTYEEKRMINGVQDFYYKYKENGKTQRAIVDSEGNVIKLIEIADHGKKEFITVTKLQEVTKGTKYPNGLDSLPKGVKCKCDAKGNLTFFNKNDQELKFNKETGEFEEIKPEKDKQKAKE